MIYIEKTTKIISIYIEKSTTKKTNKQIKKKKISIFIEKTTKIISKYIEKSTRINYFNIIPSMLYMNIKRK